MRQVDALLEFWFGAGDTPSAARRTLWFAQNPDFDRSCETRFRDDYEAAAAGKLDSWKDNARGCLALILLLDQIPRNVFRNSPRAFATDRKAGIAARHAIERGYDRELTPWQRMFLCMPFQHSEELDDQQESMRLSSELEASAPEVAGAVEYARAHFTIIRRFGRFPHRNAILGRESTTEEADFLRDHGDSF
ncbi:MAG: DUF924 family protein [Candidatus Binatus sp.]